MNEYIYNKKQYATIKYKKDCYPNYIGNTPYNIYRPFLHEIYDDYAEIIQKMVGRFDKSDFLQASLIKHLKNNFDFDNIDTKDYITISETNEGMSDNKSRKQLSFYFIDNNYDYFVKAKYVYYEETYNIAIDFHVYDINYISSDEFTISNERIFEDYIKDIKLIYHDDNDNVKIELYNVIYKFKFDPLDESYMVCPVDINMDKLKDNTVKVLFDVFQYHGWYVSVAIDMFFEMLNEYEKCQSIKNIILLLENGIIYDTGGEIYLPTEKKKGGTELIYYAPGLTNETYQLRKNCDFIHAQAFRSNKYVRNIEIER